MNAYLLEIDLPVVKTDDYLARLPEQREMIERLLQSGVISQFSLSADRTRAWLVVFAASQLDAENIVRKFPLYRYMTITFERLLFTSSSPIGAPVLIMN